MGYNSTLKACSNCEHCLIKAPPAVPVPCKVSTEPTIMNTTERYIPRSEYVCTYAGRIAFNVDPQDFCNMYEDREDD